MAIKNYYLTQHTPFVGRSAELHDIQARLQDPTCRLLTITGLGGSGKTRLAVEAAHGVSTEFQDGVIFVGLQAIARGELLVSAIAQAVGLTFYGNEEIETLLLKYLRERSLLLVLDNFEHLLDNAAFVSTIIAHTSTKILVTSREILNLREEWLYPLKGMSNPPSVYATSLEDYDAVQLFLHHARRVQPGCDFTHEQESIIRTCNMTAGLPLAIEIASSWLKGLTVSQIALEIERNLDFLTTTTRNVEDRHRSMRAVFDQTWKLLPDSERRILARLSVFRGGFDSGAAEAVAEASLSSLVALAEKSLIQVETQGRYSIHELLRQYSMEKLDTYQETDTIYARHSRYFAQQMARYEAVFKQPDQLEALRAIEIDFENIRMAWEWAVTRQLVDHLHQMLNGLYMFGFLRSRYRETIALFQYSLEQPNLEPSLLGRLFTRRWGYLQWWYLSDYSEPLAAVEQALAIATANNHTFEIALSQLMLGYALISMQSYGDALLHLQNSKTLFEDLGEAYYVCWVLHRIGYCYSNLNRLDLGDEYTQQSLRLARDTHNRLAFVTCSYNIGSNHILNGEYIKGKHYCTEALEVATETQHLGGIAHSLSLLALCAFCQGDYDISEQQARRSQKIAIDINLLAFQPYNLSPLILLACLRGDYAEGVRLDESGKPHNTNRMGLQLLYWALATLACGLGNRPDARMYIQKLLELTNTNFTPAPVTWIVPSAAYMVAETDPTKAIELLGWTRTQTDMGLSWAQQWPVFKQLQAYLENVVGSDSFRATLANGELLTFTEIDLYLRQQFVTPAAPISEAAQETILTSREYEILQLLAAGLTNPQIAAQLVIGAGTVKTHTLSIYRKLDVDNRTQAILRAQALGMLHA